MGQARTISPWAVATGGVLLILGVCVGVYVGVHRPAARASADAELQGLKSHASQMLSFGRYDQARAALARYVEYAPEDAEGHLLLAKTYLSLNDHPRCYQHAVRSLELMPQQEEAQFMAGVVAEQLDQLEQAAEHYRQAAAMAPQAAKYAIYYGNALLRLGHADQASRHAETAFRLDASLPEVHALLAKIDEYNGQLPQALEHNTKAMALLDEDNDKQASYIAYQAMLLRGLERPQDAVALLVAAAPELQHRQVVAEQLALAYLDSQQPIKAAGVWVELFTLDPKNARAAAEVGLCLVAAERPRDAMHYLRLAERLAPDHPAVLKLRRAIRPEAEDSTADKR